MTKLPLMLPFTLTNRTFFVEGVMITDRTFFVEGVMVTAVDDHMAFQLKLQGHRTVIESLSWAALEDPPDEN